MKPKLKNVLGPICALVCGLCLSNGALSETLPDGKGKVEFVHNCTACHRADMVTRVRKTPDKWRKSVDEMAARGTDGSKEDLDNAYFYLVKNYGKDNPGPAAVEQPSGNATSSDRMKQIIAENGCLTCHRVANQGAYTGPSLNGLGAHRTPDEIRTAIVSPAQLLDPSDYLVRLTTADGKPLMGRVLSQDDHALRVVDATGEVTTYAKPELRQLTMINTNPMPSYQKKIIGDDLDGLVRYLASLPPLDDSVHK